MAIIIILVALLALGIYLLMFARKDAGGNVYDNLDARGRKSNTNATRFGHRKEQKVMEAQAELLETINRADEAALRPRVLVETQARDLEDLQLQRAVLDLAYSEGLPLDVLTDKLRKRELDTLELKRIAAEIGIHLKAGLIHKLQAYQQFYVIREQLDGRYDQLEYLSSLPETLATQSKIAQCQLDIKMLEDDVNGQREEILRPRRRKELGGHQERDSDSPGYSPPTRIGTEE